VVTGQVVFAQGSKIGVQQLARFYPKVREHYPEAQVIYVIQDNWPIHFYPQVREASATAQVRDRTLTDLCAVAQPDREALAQAQTRGLTSASLK